MRFLEGQRDAEYYPTPRDVAEKMLNAFDLRGIKSILEPSAGEGHILKVLAERDLNKRTNGRIGMRNERVGFNVDALEIDPRIRAVLKYNFSDERRKSLPEGDPERKQFLNCGLHIVGDDFLSFRSYKHYDLILMNPPFSNGDKHLLKALKMQANGGKIVCLLNAQTIINPYTETRKMLVRLLDEYRAKIEYLEGAFSGAERKTGVEVALISVDIPQKQEESEIYTMFKKAEEELEPSVEVKDLVIDDFIKQIIARFNVEVQSGIELIRIYRGMIPYMLSGFADGTGPILRLTDSYERGYDSVSVNGFLRAVRLKYWRELMSNKKFTGRLTSKLREKYYDKVESLAEYDFSEFNIQQIATEMNAEVKDGIESEIYKLFDTLTADHSWWSGNINNRHYFDGWKTNQAHKIGKKSIIPGDVYDSWNGRPLERYAVGKLEDIERVLNFLDGNMTHPVDMERAISEAFEKGQTKNVQLKYFKATFYKKGTIHLVYTCPELIDRFNIYVAKGKSWLPPNYGKTKYEDLSADERATIDSFQGKKSYEKVVENCEFYLAPATGGNMLKLGEGE